MNNNADDFSYLKSMMPQVKDERFEKVEWAYIDDTSTGSNYSTGQVTIDGATFGNSKTPIDWESGFLAVPLVMVLSNVSGDADPGSGLNRSDYALALKQCYSNLISSIQVQIGDKTLNTQCPNIHIYNSWKQLSEAGIQSERVKTHLGLTIDDPDAMAYNTAGTSTYNLQKFRYGNGLVNNAGLSLDSQAAQLPPGGANLGKLNNDGFRKRCEECRNCVDYLGNLLSRNNTVNEQGDYSYHVGPTSAFGVADTNVAVGRTNYQAFYKTVIIRLKDCLDVFGKVGLVKSMHVKLTINFNVGSMIVRKDNALVASGLSASFLNETTFQNACPLLVNPLYCNTTNANDVKLCCGLYIANVGTSITSATPNQSTLGVPSHPLSKVRMYVKKCELTEDSALKLFDSMGATKDVEFSDITYNVIENVSPNGNVSQQIAHNLKGVCGVVLVPRVSSDIHGTTSTGAGISTFLNGGAGDNANISTSFSQWVSPFFPMVPAPLSIDRVQLTVDGKSMYPNFLEYTYEHYLENFNCINKTNGNITDECLQSGLLSKRQWELCRYYLFSWPVADVNTSHNVNIQFINNSQVRASYDVYLVSRRRMTLNTINGKVESATF